MRWRRIAGIALAVLLAAAVGERARAAEPAAVEPEAARLLRAALERIATAKAFTFAAEVANHTALPSGQRVQYTGRIEHRHPPPGRPADQLRGGAALEPLLVRREDLHPPRPRAERLRLPAREQGRLEDFLDAMKDKLGFTLPLALLLHEDVATRAFSWIKVGFVVGPATLGGVAVQHLAFSGERSDWQLWVTDGPEPVIKRIVTTYKQTEGSPQFTATFLAWDFAPASTTAPSPSRRRPARCSAISSS